MRRAEVLNWNIYSRGAFYRAPKERELVSSSSGYKISKYVNFSIRFKHSMSQLHKRSKNCNANTKRLSTSKFVCKFQNAKITIFICLFIVYLFTYYLHSVTQDDYLFFIILLHWFTAWLVYANVITNLESVKSPVYWIIPHYSPPLQGVWRDSIAWNRYGIETRKILRA